MRHTLRHLLSIGALVCFCFTINTAQDESRKDRPGSVSAADEAALRALAQEFYDAYAKKDLDGFLRLWSAKSPELASRRTAMQKLFADHEKIELKSLAIPKVTVDGEKGKARVEVEINAIEAKTGKLSTEFGQMKRSMHSVKEGGVWKVWQEASAAVDLADALVAAKTEQERAALLTEEKDLATVELRKGLITRGDRLRSQGRYPQALIVYHLAQDIAEKIDDQQGVADLLNNAGLVYRAQGDYSLAMEYAQKSFQLYEGMGSKDGVARARHNIGLVHAVQGDYGPALESFRKSLALKQEIGDKASIANTLTSIATIYQLQGNFVQAVETYQKSLELSEAAGNKAVIAQTLNNIGTLHTRQGDYSLALEALRKSLALRQEIDDKPGIAVAIGNMAQVYRAQGNYSLAMDSYQKSLKQAEESGNRAEMAGTFNNIANIHFSQGNYELASDFLQKSLTIKEELKDRAGASRTLNNLGSVYNSQGAYDLARDRFQKSLALAEALSDKEMIASALFGIGQTHLSQGAYDLALECYQKSLKLHEELEIKEGIVRNLAMIGEVRRLKGNYAQALESAEHAVAIARQTEDRENLYEPLTTVGRIYSAIQKPVQARQSLEEAIATIEALRSQVVGGEQEQQRFFEDKLAPYHATVELLVTRNQTGEALAFAERAKARVLLDVLQAGRASLTKAMTARELEQEQGLNNQLVSLNAQISHERLRPKPDASRLADLKTQLQKTRLEHEEFQIALYAAHPEVKIQRGEAELLTLEQARDLLPEPRRC